MSSIIISVPILAVVAMQLLLIPSVLSLNLTNAYLNHKCNNTEGRYSQGSAFEKNLNLVLHTIDSGNFINGFGYHEEGEDPDSIFAMYQCRGDSYGSKCRSCISTAVSELHRRCPRNKGAIIWYDQCLLEISTTKSFNKIDYDNEFYLSNPNNVSDSELFYKELSKFLVNLTKKATDKNNMKGKQFLLYAAGEKKIGTKKVYGMVQCTRDLVPTSCSACFEWVFSLYSDCCEGKQGGRVLSTSCNFRYELYPFLRKLTIVE